MEFPLKSKDFPLKSKKCMEYTRELPFNIPSYMWYNGLMLKKMNGGDYMNILWLKNGGFITKVQGIDYRYNMEQVSKLVVEKFKNGRSVSYWLPLTNYDLSVNAESSHGPLSAGQAIEWLKEMNGGN